MTRLAVTFAAVAVALSAAPSRAQVPDSSTAFDVELFELQPAQGVNLLSLFKSDVLQHLYPSFGLTFQYVDDPLELARQADQDVVVSRLVGSQMKLEPWFTFGLYDLVDVSLVLPLVLAQSGDALDFFNRPGDTAEGFALGDLRLIPKVRVLDPRDAAGFGIAIASPIYFPTGDDQSFNSYGAVRWVPTLAVDWRDDVTGITVAANVGYSFQPKTTAHNLVLDDSIRWGVGLDLPILLDQVAVLASIHGIAALESNRDPANLAKTLDDGLTSPIEVDAAVQLRFDAIVAELGGGFGVTDGVGAPDFRAFVSIGYTPITRDRDGDGILDRDDACPDDPEDKDGFEDLDGCPDLDNDKDGVLDVVITG